MNRILNIQRLLAVFLLLVLAFSATPRIYFHDLAAGHSDAPECSLEHKGTVIHAQGFHCHFDDLVVSSPFLPDAPVPIDPASIKHETGLIEKCSPCLSLYVPSKEGRGPPSA